MPTTMLERFDITHFTLLVVGVVSGHLLFRKLRTNKLLPLPPGPPSYPLIGQLLSIPQSSEERAFVSLSAELKSDIISLSFLGTTIVVLNSVEAANDLLEKRPNIYSGRFCPPMISSPGLIDLQGFLAFTDSNNTWRKQRRAMNAYLNKQSVVKFRASQELQARKLLQRLLHLSGELESSDVLDQEFYRAVSSVFLDSVYGYELKTTNDQFLIDNMVLNHNLAQAILPSNFLVNVLPWLEYVPEWFPGAHWKVVAREWREQKNRAMNGIYNWAKQNIDRGADDYSVIASSLEDAQKLGWSQAEADSFSKNLGTGLYAAMALYPEVQAKAQQEIDTVVGSERLPTVEDRQNLPYIERILMEVLRWQPSTPLGVPHVCVEDNEYRGYRIPKGAITIAFMHSDRAATRNENTFKDADRFDPDRYLDPAVTLPPVFGWGIRICPGQHFFREMFFIEVVLMLATFNIEKLKGEDGQEIEPIIKPAENSAAYRPATFKVKLSPRSELHADLIRGAA
ncbi:hypothetical protein CTheo_3893 [Ceratobasidium theobromae]|uniref:O-methylsterigmatocystin oxidoreductase n=1 Tax=Ceratobasidium theobromae TaxID=1582974 RepID=A0A5N5QMA7_9AGAM|nr:hypothetical protein CTheo_3893 [Ceratobasidium theobromae]